MSDKHLLQVLLVCCVGCSFLHPTLSFLALGILAALEFEFFLTRKRIDHSDAVKKEVEQLRAEIENLKLARSMRL